MKPFAIVAGAGRSGAFDGTGPKHAKRALGEDGRVLDAPPFDGMDPKHAKRALEVFRGQAES